MFFKGVLRRLLHTGVTRLQSSSRFTEQELLSLGGVGKPLRGHLPELVKEGGGGGGRRGERLLVVMVGWTQSRHKALAKYAAIYNQMGLPCVTMAPHVTLTWYTSFGNRNTKTMLELLDKSLTSPVRVLYHIFSSGGIVVFPHLMTEYDNPSSSVRSKFIPAGVVFDSAPSNFSAQVGFQASKLLYKQGGFNFLTYRLANTVGFLTNMAIGSRKRSELRSILEHADLLQVPQLYLYSEKDLVCPAERVREVMEGQRKMGRQVTGHCWTDSEHVKHYVQHPEEYKQKIADFVTTL